MCLAKNLQRGDFALEENRGKTNFDSWALDQKKRAFEVRYALFDYFVNIRSSLKGRLPQLILLSKAKQSISTNEEINSVIKKFVDCQILVGG